MIRILSFFIVKFLLLSLAMNPSELRSADMRSFFPYGVHISFSGRPEGGARTSPRDAIELEKAIERTCKDLLAHDMNAAMIANCRVQDIGCWLEYGEKYGIRFFFQGGGFPMFLRPPKVDATGRDKRPNVYKEKEKVFSFWKELALKYRDKKALLAWSLSEENPPDEELAGYMAELVKFLADADPEHPAFVIDNMALAGELNAEIIRPAIVAADRYPYFLPSIWWTGTQAAAQSYLEKEFARFYHAASAADATLWIIGQGARYGGVKDRRVSWTTRYPAAAETKWQVWKALQYGAKGFFFFTYASSAADPADREGGEYCEGLRDRAFQETETYRAAAEMGQELKRLAPLMLSLDWAPLSRDVIYVEQNPCVSGKTFVHRKTGGRYVIAVNNDCSNSQTVQFELGYWPKMLDADDLLIDVTTGKIYDYNTIKLLPLLPGEGAVFFVGSAEEWKLEKEKVFEGGVL